jgi:hypothetical protein
MEETNMMRVQHTLLQVIQEILQENTRFLLKMSTILT